MLYVREIKVAVILNVPRLPCRFKFSVGFRYCASRIWIADELSVVSIRLRKRFSNYQMPIDDELFHNIQAFTLSLMGGGVLAAKRWGVF